MSDPRATCPPAGGHLCARLLAAVLACAACGGGDPAVPDAPTPIPFDERYLPLVGGGTWTYQVSDPGSLDAGLPPEVKTQTVEVLEEVGGQKGTLNAWRVRTDRPTGRETVSWQEDTGNRVLRHREQSYGQTGIMLFDETYTPYKLRLDESPQHLSVGTTWTETYLERRTDLLGVTTTVQKTETWTIEAIGEQVTVPAGTFSCLRVRRVSAGDVGGSEKTYWFAPGVGKVKEIGGQTEELSGYSFP